MAISSKDLESLWQRYKAEAVPAGISVNQFFESNGVPYHVFEKWYKKKFQASKCCGVCCCRCARFNQCSSNTIQAG